jgi:hypothetical protein
MSARETGDRNTGVRARIGVAVALAACAFASASIPLHRTGAGSIALWLFGIAAFLATFVPGKGLRPRRLSRDAVLGLALALLPVAVRILSTQHGRVHGDELITAYHSATDDLSPARFFEGVPQSADWVCQFPSPWFVLQRGWFALFGSGLDEVRHSQVPWVYVTSVCFFFVVRRLAGRSTAVVALVLYSFLAISVYIETTGLHFMAGTAIFTAFFLAALRLLEDGSAWNAAVAGVATGFCYLFYPSAYIALPVFGAFWLVHFRRTRRADFARWVLLTGAGALLVVGPFLVYALTVRNYFTQRSAQILFLNHHTIEYDAMPLVRRVPAMLAESLDHAVRSLGRDRLGGAAGYWFGDKALFDRVTLVVFVAGLLVAFWKARRNAGLALALVALGIAFLTGVVMTVPPVGYHRLSVVYPVVALVLALPFRLFDGLDAFPPVFRKGLQAVAVAAVASANYTYFSRIAMTESEPTDLFLGEWLNTRYADRVLYVAAFPGYAYRKLAYFAPTRRKGPTISDYHTELLQRFNTEEKYLYLVTLGGEFRARFSKMDPRGRYVLLPWEDWAIYLND